MVEALRRNSRQVHPSREGVRNRYRARTKRKLSRNSSRGIGLGVQNNSGFGSGRDGNVTPSPRGKEKKNITLRFTIIDSCEDAEDSTSDEDELQTGLVRNLLTRNPKNSCIVSREWAALKTWIPPDNHNVVRRDVVRGPHGRSPVQTTTRQIRCEGCMTRGRKPRRRGSERRRGRIWCKYERLVF